jgi:hypothetical protein
MKIEKKGGINSGLVIGWSVELDMSRTVPRFRRIRATLIAIYEQDRFTSQERLIWLLNLQLPWLF